jgi:pyrroline-5-carboxylate reductase
MVVGFLGAGHIARALSRGWSSCAREDGDAVSLAFNDIDGGRAADLAAACGGRACDPPADLRAAADLVVIAVRPHEVAGLARSLSSSLGSTPVVSLAAGVTVSTIAGCLGPEARVGRVMPNVAAAVCAGVFLLAAGTLGAAELDVRRLFAQLGDVIPVDEALFDAATVLSGCVPGFAALMMEPLEEAGTVAGLDRDTARRLVARAFVGAGELVAAGSAPAELCASVSSPGGMTAAGVAALRSAAVPAALRYAYDAALRRGGELE